MSDNKPYSIECIFRNLDTWRHLPGFRLEPQIAPFFSLFMVDILNRCLAEKPIEPTVIPEFPLRNADFPDSCGFTDNNGSKKVDYLAVANESKTAYLVELKTDAHSIDRDQLQYLKAAEKEIKFHDFVAGIFKMAKNSGRKKSKYVHLLHQMNELDLIPCIDSVYAETFSDGLKRGRVTCDWNRSIKEVCRNGTRVSDWCTKVVFILPNELVKEKLESEDSHFSSATFIYFKDVAKIVKKKGKLGASFARYLCKWQHCNNEAGSRDPRCLND